MIRLLYKVENEAGDLSSDERKALRQERSKPRLEQIKEWLEREHVAVLPKSPIGQAIGYALNNWTALTRYVDDGDLHIDREGDQGGNPNPAENAIRSIVLVHHPLECAGWVAWANLFARAASIADTGKLTLAHVTLYTLNIYGVCPCRPLQTRKMRCDPILGRKNWLFAGSDKGGHTAAVLSSFVASCRRHEIDPFAYLRDVLTNFAPCPINEIDQFLPDCWNAARATKQA